MCRESRRRSHKATGEKIRSTAVMEIEKCSW